MRDNKMAMGMILLTIKPDYLSLIHWNNTGEEKKCFLQLVY